MNIIGMSLFVMNRSSFMSTVLIVPSILMLGYYFSLQSEVKYLIDPETNKNYDSDQ